jgi:DNA-binding GntR family transcriptional regulator
MPQSTEDDLKRANDSSVLDNLTELRQTGGENLRTAVSVALREAIIHRVLPPGSRLVENEVAARLNVSRNPVREAFRSLEQEGWVHSYPSVGVYVSEPSETEVLDLFEVRRVLEGLAAELAASRRTQVHLAQLAELIDEANGSTDLLRLTDLNAEFHCLVGEASANRELIKLLPQLSNKTKWMWSAVATERVDHSWREHAELVTAIEARERGRARELAEAHVDRTKRAYVARSTPAATS